MEKHALRLVQVLQKKRVEFANVVGNGMLPIIMM